MNVIFGSARVKNKKHQISTYMGYMWKIVSYIEQLGSLSSLDGVSTESLGYGMEIRRITHNYWRSQDELSIGLKEVHDVIKGQTAENLADFGGPIYLDSF